MLGRKKLLFFPCILLVFCVLSLSVFAESYVKLPLDPVETVNSVTGVSYLPGGSSYNWRSLQGASFQLLNGAGYVVRVFGPHGSSVDPAGVSLVSRFYLKFPYDVFDFRSGSLYICIGYGWDVNSSLSSLQLSFDESGDSPSSESFYPSAVSDTILSPLEGHAHYLRIFTFDFDLSIHPDVCYLSFQSVDRMAYNQELVLGFSYNSYANVVISPSDNAEIQKQELHDLAEGLSVPHVDPGSLPSFEAPEFSLQSFFIGEFFNFLIVAATSVLAISIISFVLYGKKG